MSLVAQARYCNVCQDGESFKDTQLHCVGIWLHALRYEVGAVRELQPLVCRAAGVHRVRVVKVLTVDFCCR